MAVLDNIKFQNSLFTFVETAATWVKESFLAVMFLIGCQLIFV